MDIFWSLLIDIGILSVIGLLYYFYQKRKIIKISRLSIQEKLDEFRFILNQFTEDKKSTSQYEELNSYSNQFEQAYKELELSYLSDFFQIKTPLNADLEQRRAELLSMIEDHIKAE